MEIVETVPVRRVVGQLWCDHVCDRFIDRGFLNSDAQPQFYFQPEDYKRKPFVDEGIFRYTRNGMYTFGFFSLWIPGLLLQSKAALCMALFSHLYIWVHYYCTELPDLRTINGEA